MLNLRKLKRWMLFFIIMFIALSVATPVLADYLGPNRTIVETVGVCKVILNECQYVEAKDDWGNKSVEDWLCSNESKPWQAYSGDRRACNAGNNGYQFWSREESSQETTVTYPPATISGSLQNCTLQNGWCGVTAPQLTLSANEPVAGYGILLIEGMLNGQIFACPNGAASCSIPLNQGDNNFTYWALSSWGDSSVMSTSTARVDTVSPQVGLDINGATGTNGWYVSPTTITTTSSDATSGIASSLLSIDSGAWQPAATLNEGVYQVDVTASDNAGNVSNSSTTISVDTTTPSINISVNGTAGRNGWYKSAIQISALASDATSGVATFEVSADRGAYQSYISPISFSDGVHTIQFKSIDQAGNITETALQTFYVDTISPAIELPTWWELGKEVPYSVRDDGSGLDTLRLVIEDEDEKYAKVAHDIYVSGASFFNDINWNGEFRDKTVAPAGTYLVWLKASDIAGNERIQLGKVIVPEPNTFINLFASEDPSSETPIPPEDLSPLDDSSPNTIVSSLDFGGATTETKETVTQSLFLTTGTAAAIPASSSNILWGAAAAAAIGAATASALEGKRKHKQVIQRPLKSEEPEPRPVTTQQRLVNADTEERRAKRKAQKMKKLEAQWAQERAWEEARLEKQRQAQRVQSDHMERKMAHHEAEEDAKWIAAQERARLEQQRQAQRVQSDHMELKMAYRDAEDNVRWTAAQVAIQQREQEKKEESNWWEKTVDWIDDHQAEIALGIGVIAGAAAIVLTGGLATPIVAIALVAGATVAAGGAAAAMTIGLNAHYDRPWHQNLLKNVALAGGAALAVSAAGFIIQGASVAIGSYCAVHQSTCARVEPVLNAVDKVEETWLRAKLAYQTWRKDEIGAFETAFELHSDYLDGGMPGNVVAKELGEQFTHLSKNAVPVVQKYGNDVIPLLAKYGDDGLALIQRFGPDGIDLLRKYGNDATDLIVLDDDVLDYVMQQGPDAVEALSRWSKADLLAHGPELALRAKKDAEVLANIKKLTSSGPVDPKNLTEEQKALIEAIAANSTQYADNGQVVLGKWVDNSSGFVQTAQDTGSVHYNPHPDMWTMLGRLGDAKQEEVAWLINKQVVQNGIAKGLPFEYTLNGIPSNKIADEGEAIEAIFAGATDPEIMDILRIDYMPVRMKELQELQKAGYEFTFDTVNKSYILVKK
jgi:hypothetical protein